MSCVILVRGLVLHAHHGVGDGERSSGQPFVLSLEAEADVAAACLSDQLQDTVCYSQMIAEISAVFTTQSFSLLEAAAHAVIDHLFAVFPPLSSITLTLEKPHAPIDASFESVGVRLSRRRRD